MNKNSYTIFQETYGEPGIAIGELARVLHEAGADRSPGRLRRKIENYAHEHNLLIDMKELGFSFEDSARYLVLLSTAPEIVRGADIPVNDRDLESGLAQARDKWNDMLARKIKQGY